MLSVWARTLVFFAIAQTAALELRIADAVAADSGPAGYHLLRVVALPDVTGWDYLEIYPEGRSLFISNNAGVIVINIDTMERIGTVPKPPNLPGVGLVHGVAVA